MQGRKGQVNEEQATDRGEGGVRDGEKKERREGKREWSTLRAASYKNYYKIIILQSLLLIRLGLLFVGF